MNHSPTAATIIERNAHMSAFKMPTADLADLTDHAPRAPAIDMAMLRQRCLGNESFAMLLLDEFQACVPKQLVGLARLVADANAQAIHDVAHSLKGIAGTLAAEGLRQATTELETGTSTNDWPLILNCVTRVHREALRCLAEISHHRVIPTGSEFADALLQQA